MVGGKSTQRRETSKHRGLRVMSGMASSLKEKIMQDGDISHRLLHSKRLRSRSIVAESELGILV